MRSVGVFRPAVILLPVYLRRLQEEIKEKCRDIECCLKVLEKEKVMAEEIGARLIINIFSEQTLY